MIVDLDLIARRLAAEYNADLAEQARRHLAELDARARWTAHALVTDEGFAAAVGASFLVLDLIAAATQLENKGGTDEGLPRVFRHVADLIAAEAQALDGARST